MTTDVRDEQQAKNGVVRRHAAGVMRAGAAGAAGAEPADLGAMCRHVADLARTRAEPPRRIRVEHLGTALEIEWSSGSGTEVSVSSVSVSSDPGSPSGAQDAAGSAVRDTVSPAVDDGLRRVCAPMIGTFFHAPEPGAPSFVSVGDTVAVGEQIGILEVMKMMSAVKADVAGTVREILVPDGGAVEFQQPLIAVEPAGVR